MSAMGLGGVQMSLPQIGESFNISGANLTWLLASFSLTSGSFLLLFGTLSDLYGRKRILLASYVWFSFWCLVSGFMKNHIVFDVMRGLQGIGNAHSEFLAMDIFSNILQVARHVYQPVLVS